MPHINLIRVMAWRWDIRGMQVYDAPEHAGQWLATETRCPECEQTWATVVPLRHAGAECPFCGHVDLGYVWGDDETDD